MTFHFKKTAKIEDPGADLLDSLTGLFERYGRVLMIAVGVVVVAAVAIMFTVRGRAAAESQAASMLAEASVLYWQGQYDQSLTMAKQVNQQYPTTPSGIDALRLAGDNAYWNGDFETAVTEYRSYLSQEKRTLLRDSARRSLAYALESAGKLDEAAKEFEGLVGAFDRESSGEFLASAARCYRALDRPQEAIRVLERLVSEFGDTAAGSGGRLELAEVRTSAK